MGMTAHEQGYLAYVQFGRAARNPFERQERSAAAWQRGFEKARQKHEGKNHDRQ